jgi:hypothetical protein
VKKKVTRNSRTEEVVAVEYKHNGKTRDKKETSVTYSHHRLELSLAYLSPN